MTVAAPSFPRRSDLPWALLAGGITVAVGSAALFHGRTTWWFADDWNSFANYADGSLLTPFNGHLSVLPAVIFRVLYGTVGMGDYLPYRILALSVMALFVVVLWHHVRVVAGAPLATGVVIAVVASPSAASNLMFPFLVNFGLPLVALVMFWRTTDRAAASSEPDTRADLAAGGWLAVALASSGLGLLVLGAAVVESLLDRAPLRRWLALAPGPLLWALWYAANREESAISTDPSRVVPYAARMLLGGLRALGGGWTPAAVVVAVALVALTVLAVRAAGARQPRLWAAWSVPLAFVALTSVTRVDTIPAIPPDELRYAWTVGVGLLLVVVAAVAALRGAASPVPRSAVPAVGALWAVALLAGAVALWSSMQDWALMVESSSPGIRSNLYAAEAIGADRADGDHVLPLSFEPVTTADYLTAVAAVGSPLAGVRADQMGGSAALRADADRQLVTQLPIALTTLSTSPVGCDGPAEPDRLSPGRRFVVEPLDQSSDSGGIDIRIARLAGDAGAIPIGTVSGTGALLDLPEDATTADRPVLDYRLVSDTALRVRSCDPVRR